MMTTMTGVAAPIDLRQGYADVFAEHHGQAFRLAYLLCGDRARAEDAVSEAFARVWPHWRRGKVDDVGPYVRRAVVNQVHSGFRRRLLERREESKATGEGRGDQGTDDVVVDRDSLRRALAVLPDKQRAAVVLRYFDDCSEAETAEILGVSTGTVKAHVSRGLDRLRVLLAQDGDER